MGQCYSVSIQESVKIQSEWYITHYTTQQIMNKALSFQKNHQCLLNISQHVVLPITPLYFTEKQSE
jgi:hypothetical protein